MYAISNTRSLEPSYPIKVYPYYYVGGMQCRMTFEILMECHLAIYIALGYSLVTPTVLQSVL